ncbi:unnamed protein product [Prunus brigantina]
MEALQQEMVKMQEHNSILSSKLGDTQRQLYDQQSHLAQLSQQGRSSNGRPWSQGRDGCQPTAPHSAELFCDDLPPANPTICLLF